MFGVLCFGVLCYVEIDLTFIDDTPLLLGHTVYAEFSADRPGLEFYCHLTHLDPPTFREDCTCNTHTTTLDCVPNCPK